MTEVLLINHGEADYSFLENHRHIAQRRTLSGLSAAGIQQAEELSSDSQLFGAELIISSPYTRALQTAAILSKNLSLGIKIEYNLHEWLADVTFQNDSLAYIDSALQEYIANNGIRYKTAIHPYEEYISIWNRMFSTLLAYTPYNKIVVISHKVAIEQFTGQKIANGSILNIAFDKTYRR